MGYLRGDYLRGDHYQGDPFNPFKAIGGAISGFIGGGPVGAITGGLSGLFGKSKAKPPPPVMAPFAQIPTPGQLKVRGPGGQQLMTEIARQRAFRAGKSRKMNVLNQKALKRASRRLAGYGKVYSRVKKDVGKAARALGAVPTRRALPKRVSIKESGPGGVEIG